jgi:ankyrin repeat protein
MLATGDEWPQTVELLLRSGADPAARNLEGNTALAIARDHRHEEIERLLVEAATAGPQDGRMEAGTGR